MVGVGLNGSESVLARVSIVNLYGALVLDRYAKPIEKVTDYRTWVSGIKPQDLHDAPPFHQVQAEVSALIKGKVLVGHSISNDLHALLLSHPKPLIRDTAAYRPLQDLLGTKWPSLKGLAKVVLGIDIQVKGKPHNSAEDARATMAIFRTQKKAWDELIRSKRKGHGASSSPTKSGSSRIWQSRPRDGTQAQSSQVASSSGSSRLGQSRKRSTANDRPAAPLKKVKVAPAKAEWWKDDL